MKRFKKVYSQGTIDVIEIWVDTETGVNYVFHHNGNAAGFTPLLNKDGKPVVTQQFLVLAAEGKFACEWIDIFGRKCHNRNDFLYGGSR